MAKKAKWGKIGSPKSAKRKAWLRKIARRPLKATYYRRFRS